MAELTIEQRLAALGDALQFPAVESLADDVVAALAGAGPAQGVEPWPRRRQLLLLVAAVVVVVAGVVALVPDTRHAVARWLGFERLSIERVERLPPVAPARLGPAMTMADAGAEVGVRLRVASGLGDPLSIHAPIGRYVAVRYDDDGRDVLVTTLPGRLDGGLFRKLVDGGVAIDEVTVGDAPAYWIAGRTHVFLYVGVSGEVEEARLAEDTLVWQDGDVIVRVEGEIPLDRALAIAARVHEPESGG